MSAGRKTTPTALKLVTGNPGRRPLPKNEPVPIAPLGTPPSWLSPDQKKIWNQYRKVVPEGLLKKIDTSIYLSWVVAFDLYRQANEKLIAEGLMVFSPVKRVLMQNPYLGILNRQSVVMKAACAEMGFTPASRPRIVMDAPAKADDPTDRFFNRKSGT